MSDAPEHITVYDGKYTLIMEPTNMRALRYGEPWRDLIGDGFVMALGQEISDLRIKLAAAYEAILRGHTEAANHEEMWLEEARQASAEHDEAEDKKCCAHANRFAKVIDVMQPVLGEALRAKRVIDVAKAREGVKA